MIRRSRTLLAIASLVFGTTLTAHAQTDEPEPESYGESADTAGEGTWTDEAAPEPAPESEDAGRTA